MKCYQKWALGYFFKFPGISVHMCEHLLNNSAGQKSAYVDINFNHLCLYSDFCEPKCRYQVHFSIQFAQYWKQWLKLQSLLCISIQAFSNIFGKRFYVYCQQRCCHPVDTMNNRLQNTNGLQGNTVTFKMIILSVKNNI